MSEKEEMITQVDPATKYHEHYRSRESRIFLQLPLAEQTTLQNIVELLASQMEVPVAHLTLLEGELQHIIHQVGTQLVQMPRATSFCTHTIKSAGTMVVPDAAADPLFAQAPVVAGPPFVRFYAGRSIVTQEGFAIGTLCVYDVVPRQLSTRDQALLNGLSKQVEASLSLLQEQQIMRQLLANAAEQEEDWRQQCAKDQSVVQEMLAAINPDKMGDWPVHSKQLTLHWTAQLKRLGRQR